MSESANDEGASNEPEAPEAAEVVVETDDQYHPEGHDHPATESESLTLSPEDVNLVAEKENKIAKQKERLQRLEVLTSDLRDLTQKMKEIRHIQAALQKGANALNPDAQKRILEREFKTKANAVHGELKATQSSVRIQSGQAVRATESFAKKFTDSIAGMKKTIAQIQKGMSSVGDSIQSPSPKTSSTVHSVPSPVQVVEELEELATQAKDDALISSGMSIMRCPYTSDHKLDGIIAWMTNIYNGNPCEKGAIEVTASGCLDDMKFPPKNIADLNGKTAFVSANQPGQWVCYDFKQRKVRLTHYALRSRFDGFKGSNNPKSWILEGSEDGSSWVQLDSKTNNNELNGKDLTVIWKVNESEELKLVRLRLTDVAHSGKNYLALSAFELFGTLTNA